MEDSFKRIDQRVEMVEVKASVILSCYNQEHTIGAVLDALFSQSLSYFEIVVADDGSTDKSHDIIRMYPVLLVSQRNIGKDRKARILNEASRHVRSSYIILLDGDCIPHQDFVKFHLDEREEGRYLAGRRIDLSKELTDEFLSIAKGKAIQRFLLSRFWRVERLNRIFPVRNAWIRKLFRQDRVIDMMGCNGSFWYRDFVAVDGFDECYQGYCREDGDLDKRFSHAGLRIKSVKGLALVYHLWHPRRQSTNEKLFENTIVEKRVRAVRGLSGGA